MNRLFALAFLVLPLIAVAQTRSKTAPVPAPKPPADSQLYHNTTVGFRYEIPYAWVDRTREMREQDSPEKADAKNDKPGSNEKSAVGQGWGEVLLAVFERPPDAIGESINSAVVIASESAASYPRLKKAEDYIDPLTELTTSKGFKVEGNPTIVNVDSKPLIRVDFTKHLTDTLTMHQSTLVLLAKGRVVSFTFIGGSEDEVDQLIENLSFATNRPK